MAQSTIRHFMHPICDSFGITSQSVAAGASVAFTSSIPQKTGYTPHVMSLHISDTVNVNYGRIQIVWSQSGNTINAHIINSGESAVSPSPRCEVVYIPD